jgi:hypothetical protein
MRGDHCANQLSAPDFGHIAFPRGQNGSRNGVDQIAFAQRGPIEAIGLIKKDFMRLGFSAGSLS